MYGYVLSVMYVIIAFLMACGLARKRCTFMLDRVGSKASSLVHKL